MVNLEIRDLQLVAAVADTGSLTRASEELHVTQSALSHQLRRLEDTLGVQLFLRQHRHMRPTAAGERLLRSARSLLAELMETERSVRQVAADPELVVRLTTECYTCYHWLPEVLRPFGEKYPQVRVEIDTEARHLPLRKLSEGGLDLAVTSSRVSEQRFAVRQLFEDELVVIVASDHPLAGRKFVHPADLAPERIILWTPPEESTLLNKYLKPASVTPASVQVVGLTEAVIALVKARMGVGFMARWAIQPQVEDGSLCTLSITAEGCRRRWNAIMPRTAARAAHMQEFVRLLVEHAPVGRTERVVNFRARA